MSAPIFIKIEQYRDVLNIMSVLKNKIKEGKEIVAKINQLKNEEDVQLSEWATELEELEKRLELIDKSLVKA